MLQSIQRSWWSQRSLGTLESQSAWCLGKENFECFHVREIFSFMTRVGPLWAAIRFPLHRGCIHRFLHTPTSETKFITSPIFYVNSKPHIGHLYSATLADVFKRYWEFQGFHSMYSIGTDEHGLKIQQQAEREGLKPLELCDRITLEFKTLFDSTNVSYTDYIRTTEKRHEKAVHEIWNRLMDGGYIYKGYHEGWYSISDECFVPESQTYTETRDGKEVVLSKESGKPVEWTREENYKFKLNEFKARLLEWLEESPNAIVPPHAYREVLQHLKSPDLGDISVSRLKSRVQWGISVPNDPDHVVYVWLDALTNYLTVSGYPLKTQGWPATLHVVGKDILKFHAIYWPAFLMAAGLPLPKQILSHGHWLIQNQKMSKSSGNGVDPFLLIDHYGIDPIRYFLIRDGGITIDPEFSLATIWRRYKHDLAGHLGNLCMRCSSKKINPSGMIPTSVGSLPLLEEEKVILEMCRTVRGIIVIMQIKLMNMPRKAILMTTLWKLLT
jgi:methionyl-tRNA synthetase